MRYVARFSFPARNDPDPWRIIDCDSNNAVWSGGAVARYDTEAAAHTAAAAMNVRDAAMSPAGRALQSEIDNRRTSYAQLFIGSACAVGAAIVFFLAAHQVFGGYAHMQRVVQGIIP